MRRGEERRGEEKGREGVAGGACGKFQTRKSGLGRHSGQDLENGLAPSDDPTGWACVPASPHGCFGHRRMDVHTDCRNENSHGVGGQLLVYESGRGLGTSDGAVRCGAMQSAACYPVLYLDGKAGWVAIAMGHWQGRAGSCWV